MEIDKTIDKTIRKYARLRGDKNPALNYKTMKEVYDSASLLQKLQFEKEMNMYFKFIKLGKVKKGQSILHSIYETNSSRTD